jgi:pimeloyl-ACP methyl ester carboxylesterase
MSSHIPLTKKFVNPRRKEFPKAPAATDLALFEGRTASNSWSQRLERLLPEKGRQGVITRDADHGMWFQQPEACRKAALEFLRGK